MALDVGVEETTIGGVVLQFLPLILVVIAVFIGAGIWLYSKGKQLKENNSRES